MSQNSHIEWTDATWNPVLGCDKISPGCKNCYAIRTAYRLQHNPNPKVKAAFEGLTVMQGGKPNWTGRVNVVADRLREPLTWNKPRHVFVNSQSDLFHDGVSDQQIDQIFAVMGLARRHTFQILTKRPARMLDQLIRLSRNIDPLEKAARDFGYTFKFGGTDGQHYSLLPFPLPNVWLGVSCENQETADERIPLLLQTPAAVRWVSAEPLLGAIDLDSDKADGLHALGCGYEGGWRNCPHNHPHPTGIDWLVCGGESGPGARPMHPDWARSLRDQCQAAGVPFFFKQWGAYEPIQMMRFKNGPAQVPRHTEFPDGQAMDKVGKKAAGRLLDGKEYNEYPEVQCPSK